MFKAPVCRVWAPKLSGLVAPVSPLFSPVPTRPSLPYVAEGDVNERARHHLAVGCQVALLLERRTTAPMPVRLEVRPHMRVGVDVRVQLRPVLRGQRHVEAALPVARGHRQVPPPHDEGRRAPPALDGGTARAATARRDDAVRVGGPAPRHAGAGRLPLPPWRPEATAAAASGRAGGTRIVDASVWMLWTSILTFAEKYGRASRSHQQKRSARRTRQAGDPAPRRTAVTNGRPVLTGRRAFDTLPASSRPPRRRLRVAHACVEDARESR